MRPRVYPKAAAGMMLACISYATASLSVSYPIWVKWPVSTPVGGAGTARFQFNPLVLAHPPHTVIPGPGVAIEESDGDSFFVRKVNPSVRHIRSWISSVGAAISVEDLNGDGFTNEAVWVDPRINKVILTQLGDRDGLAPFVLEPSGLPSHFQGSQENTAPMGSLIGDFNEDGRLDILVYYWGRSPVIFLRKAVPWSNPGGNASPYVALELCQEPKPWFTNAATLADLDGDGHIDLVVGNYFQDGATVLNEASTQPVEMQDSMSHAFNGGWKHFFLGTGRSNASTGSPGFAEAQITIADKDGKRLSSGTRDAREKEALLRGWTLAMTTANFDADEKELPDLFLANDYGPDRLLLNFSSQGHLKFHSVQGRKGWTDPKSCVLGMDSFKGMGVDAVDLDHDGLFDVITSNIAEQYALQESHHVFLSGHFYPDRADRIAEYRRKIRDEDYIPLKNHSEAQLLSRSGWGWDIKAASFDNGMAYQIIQATGFVAGNRFTAWDNPKGEEEVHHRPLSGGSWGYLHELATANDVCTKQPRFWWNCVPGENLSGNNHLLFFADVCDSKAGKTTHSKYANLNADRTLLSASVKKPTKPMISRGLAVADFNGDGRLDFAVANQWQDSYQFLNETEQEQPGACVQLRLLLPLTGSRDETKILRWNELPADISTLGRPAIGATAVIRVKGKDGGKERPLILMSRVDGGSGHSGRGPFDLHFGLGSSHEMSGRDITIDLKWRGLQGELLQDHISVRPASFRRDGTRPFRYVVLLKQP